MSDPASEKPERPELFCGICGTPSGKARRFFSLVGAPKGEEVRYNLCRGCLGPIVGILAKDDPEWFAEQLEAATSLRDRT